MSEKSKARWRVRLKAPAERVYWLLGTDAERTKFWTEQSTQRGETMSLVFPNGLETDCKLLRSETGTMHRFEYFDDETAFSIAGRPGAAGLTVEALPPAEDFEEMLASWVSVPLNLKAARDHGIDIGNHDREAFWDQGYADD